MGADMEEQLPPNEYYDYYATGKAVGLRYFAWVLISIVVGYELRLPPRPSVCPSHLLRCSPLFSVLLSK